MPAILLLFPAVISYLFFIPYTLKAKNGSRSSKLPHIAAIANVLFNFIAITFLFMDFSAALRFSVTKLVCSLLCSVGFMCVFLLSALYKAKNNVLLLLALSCVLALL